MSLTGFFMPSITHSLSYAFLKAVFSASATAIADIAPIQLHVSGLSRHSEQFFWSTNAFAPGPSGAHRPGCIGLIGG